MKREIHHGGHVWGQLPLTTPALPFPISWRWMKTEDGLYEPLDNFTRGFQSLLRSGIIQLQERLCEGYANAQRCTHVKECSRHVDIYLLGYDARLWQSLDDIRVFSASSTHQICNCWWAILKIAAMAVRNP